MGWRVAAGAVAAHTLSPIDLVPNVVPVLGYLDDPLIVPLGILLAVRLVRPTLMAEFRATATAREGRPVSKAGLIAVVAICMMAALWLVGLLWPGS